MVRMSMQHASRKRQLTCLLALWVTTVVAGANAQEVVVLSGVDEAIAWMKSENWWGEAKRGAQLQVPHTILTCINPRWRQNARKLPVPQKKEIFYRVMLPLIAHANTMVMDRREWLFALQAKAKAGEPLPKRDMQRLRDVAVLLRIMDAEKADALTGSHHDLPTVIDAALYKLDIIPAGLALAQAAYESGYGTSRFAVEGNALFGQWTYGGKGLIPGQQRKHLGDHRIAAYDWPFDSVRGYFINLMSHPAYEDFRRLRAKLRAKGKPLTSMALADGLIRYSERGQKYIDTLASSQAPPILRN